MASDGEGGNISSTATTPDSTSTVFPNPPVLSRSRPPLLSRPKPPLYLRSKPLLVAARSIAKLPFAPPVTSLLSLQPESLAISVLSNSLVLNNFFNILLVERAVTIPIGSPPSLLVLIASVSFNPATIASATSAPNS